MPVARLAYHNVTRTPPTIEKRPPPTLSRIGHEAQRDVHVASELALRNAGGVLVVTN
jgi:hypothetical protein